ncbi:hypothetical protein LTR33_019363, partial [Friedmanniomyces endolithicus]
FAHEAAALGAVEARGVRFVDYEVGVAGWEEGFVPEQGDDDVEGGEVAVHAVDCFYCYEDVSLAVEDSGVGGYAGLQDGAEGGYFVVGEGEALRGSGEAHAVVDAGVDGRVVDDDVAWLREAGEEADVGVEAGVAEEACWGVVEGGDLA